MELFITCAIGIGFIVLIPVSWGIGMREFVKIKSTTLVIFNALIPLIGIVTGWVIIIKWIYNKILQIINKEK